MATSLKSELYGPERNRQFHNIKSNLTRSHVLQDGEYNYTDRKIKYDFWKTSHSTDFSGAVLDPSFKQGTKSQLVHHFDMGNMSGKFLSKDIFSRSTIQADFGAKQFSKPEIQGENKVVNWPDMAPQYLSDRRVGPSEYSSTFVRDLRNRISPNYPLVDTSKLKLPLDPNKFWKQRNTNFSLGSDENGEQQRVFGRGSCAFQPDKKDMNTATDVNKTMKEMDKVSHVFRGGDYNNIAGNFVTTVNGDFGGRSVPPGEAALTKSLLGKVELDDEDEEEESPYTKINQLTKFARQITVPQVFEDAANERTYQEGAHFYFGTDPESLHSVYNKDYLLSSMVNRMPPVVKPPPSAGKLLQFDPNQSKHGKTSNSIDFQNSKYEPYMNSQGKTALEMNLDRRDTDNVVFSFDLERHKPDRQKSLAHMDYINPPSDHRPSHLAPRHDVYVDYLQTDDALPYPAPHKDTSEASHNFTGMYARGKSASKRRTKWRRDARNRWTDGRTTHFVVGYTPFDFASESQMKYKGEPKSDGEIPPAGKIEPQSKDRMLHFSHSENVLDLKAADPHITNTRESLPARLGYNEPYPERANTTSIMKKDYAPLCRRSLTDSQLKVIEKYKKILGKDISDSHFFHTDTTGRDQFRSTAMEDFISPEHMTGRKLLAAR